jgi:hypothetical protein
VDSRQRRAVTYRKAVAQERHYRCGIRLEIQDLPEDPQRRGEHELILISKPEERQVAGFMAFQTQFIRRLIQNEHITAQEGGEVSITTLQ